MTGSVHVYNAGPGRWHVEDCGPHADSYGLVVCNTKQEAVREGRRLARLYHYELTVSEGIVVQGISFEESHILDGLAIAERRLGLDAVQAALDADRDTTVWLLVRLTHDEGSARAAENALHTLATVGGAS